jgi:cysteine-rich repeat protein
MEISERCAQNLEQQQGSSFCELEVTQEDIDLGSIAINVSTFCDQETYMQTASIPYLESSSTTAEHCGNGQLEDGEECDDNNMNNADGCSSSCQEEPCTYTIGFWKNIAKPPLSLQPADINVTRCLSACAGLRAQCENLTGGNCSALAHNCEKICNNSAELHAYSFYEDSKDKCRQLAAQWYAFVMNLFMGGIVHDYQPTGSPVPDAMLQELYESDGRLLCADTCNFAGAVRGEIVQLARLLDNYNSGNIGPGHCGKSGELILYAWLVFCVISIVVVS